MSTEAVAPVSVGAYTLFQGLDNTDTEAFHEAVDGVIGVDYQALQVSKQVVSGINYRFYTKASVPNSPGYNAIVEVFKPLKGLAYVKGIIRL